MSIAYAKERLSLLNLSFFNYFYAVLFRSFAKTGSVLKLASMNKLRIGGFL